MTHKKSLKIPKEK